MTNQELKPCPFCGGKGITVSYGDRHNDDMVLVSTRCLSCKATTTQISSHRDDVCGAYEDSKTKWNTRAPQPQPPSIGNPVSYTDGSPSREIEDVDVDSVDGVVDRSAIRYLIEQGYMIIRKKGGL